MPWSGLMSTRDEAIQIRVDEQRIAGTLVAPGTLIPGVLFVHGWGGNQQHYLARARQIAALGCVCLTFNLRGHAGTEPSMKRARARTTCVTSSPPTTCWSASLWSTRHPSPWWAAA